MNKAVMLSVQPYWVFLIIARTMGWNIDKDKTVEVRKTFPKDENWNRLVNIYCSKDKKSFAKIPKEYRPLMEQFSGKVIGEFVCDKVDCYPFVEDEDEIGMIYPVSTAEGEKTCLEYDEVEKYGAGKPLYFWHISDLVIYDKPKELSEFLGACHKEFGEDCVLSACKHVDYTDLGKEACDRRITRPPQSWCYVEELRWSDA